MDNTWQQAYIAGHLIRKAGETYFGQRVAYLAAQGGHIEGKKGTKFQAMTSISGYSSHTVDSTSYSYSTTEVEALSTHTTLVELETGSSADPFVLGNADDPTIN